MENKNYEALDFESIKISQNLTIMAHRWLQKDDLLLLWLIASNRPFEKTEKLSKEDKWNLIYFEAIKYPDFSRKDVTMKAIREHFKDLIHKFDPSRSADDESSQILGDRHEELGREKIRRRKPRVRSPLKQH